MSDQFCFEYELQQAGWAVARIRHGDVSVEMTTSYLHDSLKELASGTLAIARGVADARVVFMDEPGEHQLRLTRAGDVCRYSLTWFNDWDSWDIHTLSGSRHVCDGTVPVRRLIQEVHSALRSLFEEFGESGYKERWCEHEFPLAEMRQLARAVR